MGCAAAIDRTRDHVSTSWWADGRAFIGGTASGVPLRVTRLNCSGGLCVYIAEGLGLHRGTR